MLPHTNRYHHAGLLFWAVFALVTNPVWHAVGHHFSDSHDHTHSHETEHGVDTQWTLEELCPYCDAVSHHIAPIQSKVPGRILFLLGDMEPPDVSGINKYFCLSLRPRAPPILV